MTQTADLLYKMAEFFRSEEFFEKGEDARLELSPDDVRCMNRIIKACGNAVSRQAVINAINKEMNNDHLSTFAPYVRCKDAVRKLLSVNSQTGHWIYTPKKRLVDETDEGGVYTTDYRCTCSECGGDFGFRQMSDAYCKYCGARMVKSQESEVNNG